MNTERLARMTCANDEDALTLEQVRNMRRHEAWLIRRAEYESGVSLSDEEQKFSFGHLVLEGLVFWGLISGLIVLLMSL